MLTQHGNFSERDHSESVRAMFAGIANRYDLLNHLLSGNTDKRWRRQVVSKLENVLKRNDARVLDIACGTGDLSMAMMESGKARVVGTDFCRPMLEIAARKSKSIHQDSIPFIEGDALALPFADSSFDAVTIAFGLRNVSNLDKGLRELFRVLKPEGRAAILEFSAPVLPGFRKLFKFYFTRVLPKVGGIVSGSRAAYEYLPDSVSRFPDQNGLVALMQNAGFDSVEYENVTGGVAAIHIGSRPRNS